MVVNVLHVKEHMRKLIKNQTHTGGAGSQNMKRIFHFHKVKMALSADHRD